MERKELKAKYGEVANGGIAPEYTWVYPQNEADAVIDSQEEKIRQLKRKLCLAREESAYWHARLFEGLRSPRIADKWFTRSSRYHKMADEFKEGK